MKRAPPIDPAVQEKVNVLATLHRLKTRLGQKHLARNRKSHFRNADPIKATAQLSQGSDLGTTAPSTIPPRPQEYNLDERRYVVALNCEHITGLSGLEQRSRRVSAITIRAALCRRQESGYRRSHLSVDHQSVLLFSPEPAPQDDHIDPFPAVGRLNQMNENHSRIINLSTPGLTR